MKKIDVIYNENGYIESVSDDSIHFEQENDSLVVNAHITTDKKVRAYIRAANNNSTVTDELTPEEGVYSCVVGSDYMAKGTLYIGFEMYDDAGYTERLEPLKIYIDSFVNLGGGTSDNVYIVTVKVGSVKTLANGEPATVENSGTKKDMILNFGLPRGEQGIQGIPGKDGYTPVKGKDYFTAEDIASLGIGNKVDKEEFNENKQLINWYIDDFYSLIGNKVDKVSGMGLSSNDFTNALKTRLENNTFDYYHSIEFPLNEEELYNLLDECTDEGVHLIFFRDYDDIASTFYILTVGGYYFFGEDGYKYTCYQSLFNLTDGTLIVRDGIGNGWEKISVSQTDLETAIGDVETSLENKVDKEEFNENKQLINWYIDDFYSLIGNKVDKVSGMGLSSNDFTNALKTRLENNTFDYYHSIEYPSNLKEEFNALLDECTDEGVHLIFIRDSDDTIPKWYILAVGEYYDFGEDDVTPYLYKSLFNLTDGTIVTQDSRDGSEWEKISVSQTDLASAIGDIETSLENIIQKYGLGGDSQ